MGKAIRAGRGEQAESDSPGGLADDSNQKACVVRAMVRRFLTLFAALAIMALLLSLVGQQEPAGAGLYQESASVADSSLAGQEYTQLEVGAIADARASPAAFLRIAQSDTFAVLQVAALGTLSILGVLALVTLFPRGRVRAAGMARTFNEVRRMGVWFGIVPFRQHPL